MDDEPTELEYIDFEHLPTRRRNFTETVIWLLGLRCRLFRRLYYRRGGKYWWWGFKKALGDLYG